MRGPIPKRSEDRIRRNKPAAAEGITHGVARKATKPAADKNWHPIAKRLYTSLGKSGQSDFYQSSDWALAHSICDDLSRYKKAEDAAEAAAARADEWYSLSPEERKERGLPDKPPHVPKGGSAMKLGSIYEALSRLMVTEGDRRRLRLELQPESEPEIPAEVAVMADYRKGLGLG